MAALCRLIGRQTCFKLSNYERQSLIFIRAVTLKPENYNKPPEENFEIVNMRLNRPCSPHLSIYNPQFTSVLSISHRITGMIMSGYMTMLGFAALICEGDYTTFLYGLHMNAPILFLSKAILAYPFAYHISNGVRHLSWDFGKFLSLTGVYNSGYVVLSFTIAAGTYICLM